MWRIILSNSPPISQRVEQRGYELRGWSGAIARPVVDLFGSASDFNSLWNWPLTVVFFSDHIAERRANPGFDMSPRNQHDRRIVFIQGRILLSFQCLVQFPPQLRNFEFIGVDDDDQQRSGAFVSLAAGVQLARKLSQHPADVSAMNRATRDLLANVWRFGGHAASTQIGPDESRLQFVLAKQDRVGYAFTHVPIPERRVQLD